MNRRADVGSIAIVFSFVLATDRLVDVPFFVDLLLAGVAFTGSKAGFERLVDALEGDDPADHSDEPVGARDARAAYVAGDIDESELEDRLERAFDPNVQAIRQRYASINGVGPKTCHALADVFGTLESIEQADPNDLEQINGIGPDRAAKIVSIENSRRHTEINNT